MDAKQYSEAAGQPQAKDDDDDDALKELMELIRERKEQKKAYAQSQTAEGQARSTGLDTATAAGILGTVGATIVNPYAGIGKAVLGVFTKGKVGQEIGRFLGSARHASTGDVELDNIINGSEEQRKKRGDDAAEYGGALLGFKKGGRVKKSGKALVHKKEFIVKSGIKVTKSQKMKVQKRKESKKETKKMIQKAPK